MTSTICPACPTLPATFVPVDEARSSLVRELAARMERGIARIWGGGSATPTSQALDVIDVPSFHR